MRCVGHFGLCTAFMITAMAGLAAVARGQACARVPNDHLRSDCTCMDGTPLGIDLRRRTSCHPHSNTGNDGSNFNGGNGGKESSLLSCTAGFTIRSVELVDTIGRGVVAARGSIVTL